jgi:hypothetical protein
MARHPVPGTEDYFDLRDLSLLNTDHQDEYNALAIQIRQDKQEAVAEALAAEHPGMIPDPDQEIPVRLTPKDTRPLRDLLLSWILADSSFGVPLTWPLQLVPGNVLRKALEPYFVALNGEVPEDPTLVAAPSTSASTSGETAAASPPEQPAESSVTPAG